MDFSHPSDAAASWLKWLQDRGQATRVDVNSCTADIPVPGDPERVVHLRIDPLVMAQSAHDIQRDGSWIRAKSPQEQFNLSLLNYLEDALAALEPATTTLLYTADVFRGFYSEADLEDDA